MHAAANLIMFLFWHYYKFRDTTWPAKTHFCGQAVGGG